MSTPLTGLASETGGSGLSAWLLPLVAAAFWGGLLLWPFSGRRVPWWGWLLLGALLLLTAVLVAPAPQRRPGALHAAGLVTTIERPAAVAVLEPLPPERGRSPPGIVLALLLLGVLLLGTGWAGLSEARTLGAELRRLAPRTVSVVGSLRTDPSTSDRGWSAVLDARSVSWGESDQAAIRETLWVAGSGEAPAAVRGDRLELRGQLTIPDDPGFATSLLRKGIPAELRVSHVERLGPSSNAVVRMAQGFRAFTGRSIRRLFPPKEAGLLMGLVLGDDSRLDPGVERDFRATGLGHLTVVSGENVAMVLGPVLALGGLLKLGRMTRFALCLGTVVFFVVLTGAEPSVMRAGVMAGLALFGVFMGRPRSAASILAGAVLFLVILDPTLVWAIGFQLSVAATAGMVALATPLADRMGWLPRPVALAAGTTLAAQLGVSPLLLFQFHEVPLITVLANLLAFPLVEPALLLGIAASVIGLVVLPLGRLIAPLAIWPMRLLELLADRLAAAPVAWITTKGGPWTLVVGVTLAIGLAWWLRSGRRLPRRTLVAAAVAFPLFVWSTALSAGPPAGLVIHFLDVGQGDAALIVSPAGASVLIDGGPEPDVVATKLVALGVKRLDVLVATHQHADHVEGLPAVLARFSIGVVLDPGCPDEGSPSYARFLEALAEEGLPVEHPRTGDAYEVADLRLEVLSPDDCYLGTHSDPNNDSIVLRVTQGEDVVLFPGDAEVEAQQAMLDEGANVQAPLLKVPHHGGDTSLVDFFIAVDPQIAIVEVGQPNDYGHPVPEVLAEIRATGARVFRTDQLGDITVTFAPEGLLVDSG